MGRLDVDQMLSEMSSRQVAGWLTYYGVEPWGEYSAERRMAVLATMIAGSNGVRCDPNDFLPLSWRAKVKQSWQDMKNILHRRFGTKD